MAVRIGYQNQVHFNVQSVHLEQNLKELDLTKISQEFSYEAALFSLMKLVYDNSNGVRISEDKLIIPADEKVIFDKVNFLIQFICQVSFSFTYNSETEELVADFSFLSDELELLG